MTIKDRFFDLMPKTNEIYHTRNAIVTLVIGDQYKDTLSTKVALATFRGYADRLGADFIIINTPYPYLSPMMAKFKIYDLLNEYQRILYLDADMLILPNCPNLFEIVPEDCIGGYKEAWHNMPFFIEDFSILKNLINNNIDINDYLDNFINSGCIVVSQCHRNIFEKPDIEISKQADIEMEKAYKRKIYDQPWINFRRAMYGHKTYGISHEFNFLSFQFSSANRFKSHIIHYCGDAKKLFMLHDLGIVMDMYINGRNMEVGIPKEELRWLY